MAAGFLSSSLCDPAVRFPDVFAAGFRDGVSEGRAVFQKIPDVGGADGAERGIRGEDHGLELRIEPLHDAGEGVFVVEIRPGPRAADDEPGFELSRRVGGQPAPEQGVSSNVAYTLANTNYASSLGKFVTFELTSHVNENPYMKMGTGAMVYGEHGAVLFAPNDTATLFDEKAKVLKEWKKGGPTKAGSLTDPTASLDVLHMTKYVECIRAKSQATNSPADEAVKSTLMPLLANIALDTGEPVRLDPATGRLLSKKAAAVWAREYAKGWDIERLG